MYKSPIEVITNNMMTEIKKSQEEKAGKRGCSFEIHIRGYNKL